MTKETDTVRTFVNAFNNGDGNTMNEILDDEFEFHAAGAPQPFDKQEFLGMMQNMRTAFPDWRFENVNFVSEQNPVKVKVDVLGTHKGPLDLSPLGGDKVEATGKAFKNAQGPATFHIEDGKIVKHSVDSEEGGVPGMLDQLGIEPPTPPAQN